MYGLPIKQCGARLLDLASKFPLPTFVYRLLVCRWQKACREIALPIYRSRKAFATSSGLRLAISAIFGIRGNCTTPHSQRISNLVI
jgi:hypothetical protein